MFDIFKSVLIVLPLLAMTACSDDDGSNETDEVTIPSTDDLTIDLDLSRGNYACYTFDTTHGNFTVALDEEFAPNSSTNFAQYVSEGFYDDVIFHSAIKDYYVQTGIVEPGFTIKTPNTAIISEVANGLRNYRGRIAMAPLISGESSVFNINVQDNTAYFDGSFSVFGGVVAGMDVVDDISEVTVSSREGFSYLPNENVVINSVTSEACPAAAEPILSKDIVLKYPVLEDDSDVEIDVSRGEYACYTMATNLGDIELAVDEKYAPATAANFKQYVDDNFYDGLIFHRVINGFMMQGGGYNQDLELQETRLPIELESLNGLKNYRGRIAMARTSSPHSATSQFFINFDDNSFLNADEASDGWGYTVFGGVTAGMDDIVEQINIDAKYNTSELPDNPIIIESIVPTACVE